MMLLCFLVTRLENITVASDIRFGGPPVQCRLSNEEIFLSVLDSNLTSHMASRGTDRVSGKTVLHAVIYLHLFPCDIIEADGKWGEFVSQCYSEKKEFAALKCCDSVHGAE
jgi:hypothetical protein